MPTYRNDTGQQQQLQNLAGNIEIVNAGDTIETYQFYPIAGLTRVSVTPLKNRNAAITSVSLGAEVSHPLNAATRIVLVLNITGMCTVKPQLTSAVPILLDSTENSVIFPIDLNDYPCDSLLLSGSGSCTLMELRW